MLNDLNNLGKIIIGLATRVEINARIIDDNKALKIASKKSERKMNSKVDNKRQTCTRVFQENYFRKIAGNKRRKSAELYSKKL